MGRNENGKGDLRMEQNRRDVYLVTNEEAEAGMKNYNMKRHDYVRLKVAYDFLWNVDSIALRGKYYSQNDVRKFMLDRTKPEYFLRALRLIGFSQGTADRVQLAASLFVFLLFGDTLHEAIDSGKLEEVNLKYVLYSYISEMTIRARGRVYATKLKFSFAEKKNDFVLADSVWQMHEKRRDENSGKFFTLPNSVFQMNLSGGEIIVYAYLLYCEDRRTFTCYPSYETIGSAVGMSKNTVMKYVRSLEKKGLIETEPTTIKTRKGVVHNGTLKYHITPIAPIKEAYDEKELDELRREAEMRERIAKYERHTGNSVHAEIHAENG